MAITRGNLVVGQSGGPTAVINNSLVGVIQEAMAHPQIEGIYGMVHGIQGLLHEEMMDLRQETPATLETLRDTPASALGTVRYKVKDTDYERLLEVFIAYNVRYFFYIGGNDSMDTTNKIAQLALSKGYEMHAIGVPKTVDNDLAETDHCPGFGSAARFVATAIRDTGYDTLAMGDSSPVKFMEIMGRNAGWLTASTALAKETPDDPPHLIYLPERGISIEQIVSDVEEVYHRLGYCVVAVSEGAKDESGEDLGSGRGDVDAFGHILKGGVVEFLDQTIKDRLKLRTRYDKPGYLQRSFASLQSPIDREEAYQVGRLAVRAAAEGKTGQMVTILRQPSEVYHIEYGLAPLAQVANKEHVVPMEYINSHGNGVTEEFIRYARPLIGGPLKRYARLSKHLVAKRS
ncbi:MAG: 6-phosphofructokinase [Chloroflexi bacterium]|nr:6-phosphofructokinase [Chloroflexota bacterium]